MNLNIIYASLFALSLTDPAAAAVQTDHLDEQEKEIVFEAASGEATEAFEGHFTVPENRANPDSRTLTLRYVRFPATGSNPGSPIVYLAGGPGGSGIRTARVRRFALFMALREFGDVIALDQRGTGASTDMPKCSSSQSSGGTAPVLDEDYRKRQVAALKECLAFWTDKGIDVRGYNTVQNVADLSDLRQHLGVSQLTLWGISYGSHLALAAARQMEGEIDKIVIASAEGLDQTIKLPARTDRYFERVQQAIDRQPEAKAEILDIKALMRRVHAKLEQAPVMIDYVDRDGVEQKHLWQRRNMQSAASGMISDPLPLSLLLQLYREVDQGEYGLLKKIAPRMLGSDDKIAFWPMSVLMDIASGTSADRRALIKMQAKTSLLATYLNQPLELENVEPTLVLGEEFRRPPISDIPLLLLSGTLDGRTYIESQHEAVRGFANRQLVTVKDAGHNLFMSPPEVTLTIQEFMRGEDVDGRVIVSELPDLMTAGNRLLRQ
ncbi:alpha/beta fold hydrolase [Sphingorhabdus sp. Alg231-15]|uniref:alpha/beta fold hydrolase n=1 Tax=Sphingorhabdus sp. Alg231-15 TaxID=1922222 RepID=UPI000D556217